MFDLTTNVFFNFYNTILILIEGDGEWTRVKLLLKVY